ncbi:uncharacterized protein CEXT_26791 [Caerostris extrusa]|uniref:Uncharacterized protein n=1 Tax=Caerostris extrusa TaxID=172846 RepID=A0AAV4Y047_CAEEX|nr:uncharacterized protein CEXT_26791 [Caerostris extrusa]
MAEEKEILEEFIKEVRTDSSKPETEKNKKKTLRFSVILKESYFKRPIKPWPMPCKDGPKTLGLQDRTTLVRSVKTESPKQEEKRPKNPYILPKPKSTPEKYPQNYGFPRYKMIVELLPSRRLISTDKRGNKCQLEPNPRYHPFADLSCNKTSKRYELLKDPQAILRFSYLDKNIIMIFDTLWNETL